MLLLRADYNRELSTCFERANKPSTVFLFHCLVSLCRLPNILTSNASSRREVQQLAVHVLLAIIHQRMDMVGINATLKTCPVLAKIRACN
jgi:hypothetical protein